MTISTKTLLQLPDIPTLRNISQSLAVLDAILSPIWENRYYSFNVHWAAQQAVASMRNGEGDSYLVWFSPGGAVLKGFAHESPMSPYRAKPPQIWPGIWDGFPSLFNDFLSEPAFISEETTFCIWRTFNDIGWQIGAIQFPNEQDPDGSAGLLNILNGNPQTYQQWAESYYEKSISLSAINHIYDHRPLTEPIVTALNPSVSIQDLTSPLAEIGYGT